jgi:hypothetical protein
MSAFGSLLRGGERLFGKDRVDRLQGEDIRIRVFRDDIAHVRDNVNLGSGRVVAEGHLLGSFGDAVHELDLAH